MSFMCNTCACIGVTRWAEVTAPLVAGHRSIIYVDFVNDASKLAMELTQQHGIQTGTYTYILESLV